METSFQKNALQTISRCKGRRPWLTTNDESCDEVLRTLQRGASNVWFSQTHSAISIPPWSEGVYKLLNRHWTVLQHLPDDSIERTLTGMRLAEGTPFSTEDLVSAVRQRRQQTGEEVWSAEKLREQEYEALVRGKAEVSKDQDFVCIRAASLPESVSSWFDRVMLVTRLREVRVLESFSRLAPPLRTAADSKPPIYDVRPNWLPGIEVLGEGVFLRLDEHRLQEWENHPDVIGRVAPINRRYRSKFEARDLSPDREITPRLVLMHSLCHALINQWALDSGYPAAALRERLYGSSQMSGLLIYTATSDSAGSLGGVVAQAEPDRLGSTLREALLRASWCSADPVCIEAEASGVDALNLAACHACLLLPEVSCEEMNLLLDRALLVGTNDKPELGYFRALLP
jgi:hypothetical protein